MYIQQFKMSYISLHQQYIKLQEENERLKLNRDEYIKDKENQILFLNQQLEEYKIIETSLRGEIESLKIQLSDNQKEIKSLIMNQQQDSIKDTTEQILEIKNLKILLKEKDEEIEILKNKNKNLENDLQDLKNKLQTTFEMNSKLRKLIEESEIKISELKHERDQMNRLHQDFKQSISSTIVEEKQLNSSMLIELQKQVKKRDEQIRQLHYEIGMLSQEELNK